MKHDDIKLLLVDFADDELDREETAKVEAHLKTCAVCRKEVEELQASLCAVREGIAPAPESGPPLDVVAIEAQTLRGRRYRWAMGASGALAAALLVLVISWPRTPEPSIPVVAERTAEDLKLEELRARIDALETELSELKRSNLVVVSDADLKNSSAHEEIAAILVHVGKSLEEDFGFAQEAQKRYRYTAARYGDTQAAADARDRIIQY